MTTHYQPPGSKETVCGAPVQKFQVNTLSVWEGPHLGMFVNCPECLLHRPAKRKRMKGFDGGRKFR